MITGKALSALDDMWKKRKKDQKFKDETTFKPLPENLPQGITRADGQATLQREAGSRMQKRAMADPTYSLGMYQKQAYQQGRNRAIADGRDPSGMTTDEVIDYGLGGVEDRMKAGVVTMDDALAKGWLKRKYGDHGTMAVEKERGNTTVHDRYDRIIERGGGTYKSTAPMSADDKLSQMNERFAEKAAREEAERMGVLKSAFGNPNLQPTGRVFNEDGSLNKELDFAPKPAAAAKPNVYNPGGGVGLFERTPDGQYLPVPGTQAPEKPAAEDSPLQGMGPQGPVVKKNGFIGVWNAKLGVYDGWQPMEQGVDLETIDPAMRPVIAALGKGGRMDYSQVPEYGAQSGGGELPTPQTQADFDALPAGSRFIDPSDGKTYIK